MALTIITSVGAVISILVGVSILLDRFWKRVENVVAEPVNRIETKLVKHEKRIGDNTKEIARANGRLDTIIGRM